MKESNPEIAAGIISKAFWPIGVFPVDPVDIAKKLGVRVLRTSLPEDVSGVLYKEVGKDAVILLHESDSKSRLRFTCAHELGHFYLKDGTGEQFDWFDFRNSQSTTGSDPEEVFANGFAAALLMPEAEVKSVQKLGKFALKEHFGVSAGALKIRFRKLGISHGDFQP
jgi:Zn-dependent peptidase ImmA (M78 family)